MLRSAATPRPRAALAAPLAAALSAATALFAAALPAAAHEYRVGDLEIVHPWTRATPPAAKAGGGFLVIKNEGDTPDRLIAATVTVAGHAEIHEMSVTDGVMKMRELPDGLEIPAHGEIALKPGSYHLMFIDLKEPIKAGESFPGTLTFEKAGKVEVKFKAEPIGTTEPGKAGGAAGGHDHSNMNHGDMQGQSAQ